MNQAEQPDSSDAGSELPPQWRFAEWQAQPYPFAEALIELRKLVRSLRQAERCLVETGQALAKFERIWPTDAPNLQLNGRQRLRALHDGLAEAQLARRLEDVVRACVRQGG